MPAFFSCDAYRSILSLPCSVDCSALPSHCSRSCLYHAMHCVLQCLMHYPSHCPALSFLSCPAPALPCHCHCPCPALPCAESVPAPATAVPCVVLLYVALPCPLACPPPYCTPSSCSPSCSALTLPITMSCTISFTVRCCSSRRTNRFALANPLSPVRPALRSPLSLLRIHLDFYLNFMPFCTQPCPCPVLILTPDLCPDPVYAALPSTIPYSAIFALFFLPSPAIHLALPLPSTMACPVLPSPSPSYPLASPIFCPPPCPSPCFDPRPFLSPPLLSHPPCTDFLFALPTLYLVLHPVL